MSFNSLDVMEQEFPAISRVQKLMVERRHRLKESDTKRSNDVRLIESSTNVVIKDEKENIAVQELEDKDYAGISCLALQVAHSLQKSFLCDLKEYDAIIDRISHDLDNDYQSLLQALESSVNVGALDVTTEMKGDWKEKVPPVFTRSSFAQSTSSDVVESHDSLSQKGQINVNSSSQTDTTDVGRQNEVLEIQGGVDISVLPVSVNNQFETLRIINEATKHKTADRMLIKPNIEYEPLNQQKKSRPMSRASLLAKRSYKATIIQRCARNYLNRKLYRKGEFQRKVAHSLRHRNTLKRYWKFWMHYLLRRQTIRRRWASKVEDRLKCWGPHLHHSFKEYDAESIFSQEGKHVMARMYKEWHLKALSFAKWMHHMDASNSELQQIYSLQNIPP